jgi:hypothetical protein
VSVDLLGQLEQTCGLVLHGDGVKLGQGLLSGLGTGDLDE